MESEAIECELMHRTEHTLTRKSDKHTELYYLKIFENKLKRHSTRKNLRRPACLSTMQIKRAYRVRLSASAKPFVPIQRINK